MKGDSNPVPIQSLERALGEFVSQERSVGRLIQYVFVGILALGIVGILAAGVSISITGVYPQAIAVIVVGVLFLVCGYFGATTLNVWPSSIRIDELGVSLFVKGGRTTTLSWEDPKLVLWLVDQTRVRSTQSRLRWGSPYSLGRGGTGAVTALPKDVFDRILSDSRARGLAISEDAAPSKYAPGTTITIVSHSPPPR